MTKDTEELNQILIGQEIAINGVRNIRVEFADKAHSLSLRIVDAQLFLYLQSYDLTVYHKNYSATGFEFEKKLFCRLAAMNLYEFIADTREMLGKNFRNEVKTKLPNTDFSKLNSLMARLNNFDFLYGAEIKAIRNAVIAHREHEPLKQIEVIEKIDVESFLSHIANFYLLSRDINAYLSELLEEVENAD